MKKTNTMSIALIILLTISSTTQNPTRDSPNHLQYAHDIINLLDLADVFFSQVSDDSNGSNDDINVKDTGYKSEEKNKKNDEDSIEASVDDKFDGYKASTKDGMKKASPGCPPKDRYDVVAITLCGVTSFDV